MAKIVNPVMAEAVRNQKMKESLIHLDPRLSRLVGKLEVLVQGAKKAADSGRHDVRLKPRWAPLCQGALDIIAANTPRAKQATLGRPIRDVMPAWKPGRAGLLEYASASPFRITLLGPPADMLPVLLLNAVAEGLNSSAQPSLQDRQALALRVYARTAKRHTKASDVLAAFTILRVLGELIGKRLPIYQRGGKLGSPLSRLCVDSVHRAIGKPPLGHARWPAAYVQAAAFLTDS